eukprot:CAMPEP_0197528458 /NCGR_PEP_ID=MMETSP1318-20131121/25185_1 /TAXON_ID=552666 /ORGANISM="Partenskyella glossopodia, Strain RCC365" /LENGTH=58 /DNA_ID=CAMNT_0043083573 /DNA_START=65 /DNA_END=241 /DNA_ORIENTATION=-
MCLMLTGPSDSMQKANKAEKKLGGDESALSRLNRKVIAAEILFSGLAVVCLVAVSVLS